MAPAAEVRPAQVGSLGGTRPVAPRAVADGAFGACGSRFTSAGGLALAPQGARASGRLVGHTLLALGAGTPVAVRTMKGEAEGSAPSSLNALLASRAGAALARRQAGRAIGARGAGKAFGAARGLLQLARPSAPALADQPWATGLLLLGGKQPAQLPFLERADEHTEAEPGCTLQGVEGPAGEAVWAVPVVQARTIRAIADLRGLVEDATERRLAVSIRVTGTLVGQQPLALLGRKSGKQGDVGVRPWPVRHMQGEEGHARQREDEQKDRKAPAEVAPLHGSVGLGTRAAFFACESDARYSCRRGRSQRRQRTLRSASSTMSHASRACRGKRWRDCK